MAVLTRKNKVGAIRLTNSEGQGWIQKKQTLEAVVQAFEDKINADFGGFQTEANTITTAAGETNLTRAELIILWDATTRKRWELRTGR